jgi:DNA-binding CsgD family transcriptional regulator
MGTRKEFNFAEVLVDKLFLESFANEESPYFVGSENDIQPKSVDRIRNRLRWHINNSLSPRQKQVIKHYLSGKTEREIAGVLGVAQQVVNIYKHRAIKKLHKILSS